MRLVTRIAAGSTALAILACAPPGTLDASYVHT